MANKILTVVVDTPDVDLSDHIATLVDSLHSEGINVQQIRLADDSGETLVPVPEPAPPAETTTEATDDEATETAPDDEETE